MMKYVLLLVTAITLAGFTVDRLYASESCIMCSMDARKSDTKIVIQVKKGTKGMPKGTYSLCSLHCLFVLQKHLPPDDIQHIMIRDYATVSGDYDSGDMIDATKAYYLVKSSLRPKGSMPPFVTAFSTIAVAEDFKRTYGGKIMAWKEIKAYMKDQDAGHAHN